MVVIDPATNKKHIDIETSNEILQEAKQKLKDVAIVEKPYLNIKVVWKEALSGRAASVNSVEIDLHQPKGDPYPYEEWQKAEQYIIESIRRLKKELLGE